MTNKPNAIPCPSCSTAIPFETKALLSGEMIKCPNTNCNATIGLAKESEELVSKQMERFIKIKSAALGQDENPE